MLATCQNRSVLSLWLQRFGRCWQDRPGLGKDKRRLDIVTGVGPAEAALTCQYFRIFRRDLGKPSEMNSPGPSGVESRKGAVPASVQTAGPFPFPAHQTGRARFEHPAFRQTSPSDSIPQKLCPSISPQRDGNLVALECP